MAEALRASPDFLPTSMLDFGSGGAASVMAAARVFASPFARNVRLGREGGVPGVVKNVCLIDQSDSMRSLATAVLQADFAPDALRVASTLVDKNVKGAEFDMVCASYSLNEVVRMAMALPLDGDNESLEHLSEERSVSRVSREKLAERRLRRIVKTLWNKTAPGGIFVVIEDGTAAGFEVISFVRDTILSRSPAMDVDNSASAQVVASPLNTSDQASQQLTSQETASIQTRARVLAPCLHSDTCPFHDNITRHRLCRFRQRLNRPLFSRTVRPLHDGFEDEYFSYVVIQKFDEDAHGKDVEENLASSSWGRLIRAPLMKGKHVALDVCTSSAKLERRVVSKKNAIPGHYSKARHSKWGDVWAVQPSAKPQPVNF